MSNTGARIERAASAITGLELRLSKHLELLDGCVTYTMLQP